MGIMEKKMETTIMAVRVQTGTDCKCAGTIGPLARVSG